MIVHDVTYGDSLTPIGLQLKQKDADGVLSPVDLSSRTVMVVLCDAAGTVVIDETTVGVTVEDAESGKVSYDMPGGIAGLDPGTYYLYVRVYSGTERDTFPVVPKELQIRVRKHIQETQS